MCHLQFDTIYHDPLPKVLVKRDNNLLGNIRDQNLTDNKKMNQRLTPQSHLKSYQNQLEQFF